MPNIRFESDPDPVDGAPAPPPQGVNDSDDTTIIRVQSKRTAELLLTPMAATVLQTIIEEQHSQVCGCVNIVHGHCLNSSPEHSTGFRAR